MFYYLTLNWFAVKWQKMRYDMYKSLYNSPNILLQHYRQKSNIDHTEDCEYTCYNTDTLNSFSDVFSNVKPTV